MYKLINTKNKEEHLCDKVTIDKFDYYVSSDKIKEIEPDDRYATIVENPRRIVFYTKHIQDTFSKVVICSNNPNIDIPKVVDEVEKIAEEWFLINGYNQFDYIHSHRIPDAITTNKLFKTGYKESQKTYSNSDEDMKSFGKFCIENNFCKEENRYYQYWEMLKLWKEQQPKTIYYNG